LARAAVFLGTGLVVCRVLPVPDSLLVTFRDLGHGREAVLHPLLVGCGRLWTALRSARARSRGDLLHLRILRHGFDPFALRVR
jgi:hypothetical protein